VVSENGSAKVLCVLAQGASTKTIVIDLSFNLFYLSMYLSFYLSIHSSTKYTHSHIHTYTHTKVHTHMYFLCEGASTKTIVIG